MNLKEYSHTHKIWKKIWKKKNEGRIDVYNILPGDLIVYLWQATNGDFSNWKSNWDLSRFSVPFDWLIASIGWLIK